MTPPQDQPEDLQNIWRKNNMRPTAEDYSMMLKLVQEKRRSLQDFLRGEDLTSYMIALSFAPLTALAMWKSRPVLLMQLGFSIVTVTLVAGAVVTWVNQRRASALRQMDLSVREYQTQLLRFFDQRIRFSKGVKYWYAIPLLLGFSLAVYPIVSHFIPQPWSILLVTAVFVALEYSIWRMHEVQRVTDLQRRKDEVQNLLRDMDRV